MIVTVDENYYEDDLTLATMSEIFVLMVQIYVGLIVLQIITAIYRLAGYGKENQNDF